MLVDGGRYYWIDFVLTKHPIPTMKTFTFYHHKLAFLEGRRLLFMSILTWLGMQLTKA